MFFDTFYELCKKKGVSCKKAAEEIGLSNSITTKWKKTGATPGGETLDKVAAYFGVSADYLLGKGDKNEVLPNAISEEQRFPDIYLTNSQQKMIFKILNDACSQKQITHGEAIVRAKSSTNFFLRLQNESLHQACSTDILTVAEYLGVKEDVKNIIFRKPSLDNFSYAMHEEAEELSDESKALLLNLAKQLREKAHKNNGEIK